MSSVYLDTDQLRWLRSHFDPADQAPPSKWSEPWAPASMLGVALEALQQTPEAVTRMCQLRDAYNEEADRQAAMRALEEPTRYQCDKCTRKFRAEQVVPRVTWCPACGGQLQPIP